MKIQSIIRRANGSTVKLGSMTYCFTPGNDHACEVEDRAHIDLLLSIKEGFREAPGGEGQPKAAKADDTDGNDQAKTPRQPRQPKAAKADDQS